MFLISGVKSKAIASVDIANVCESCGQNHSLINVYQHYLHIFWIPFFPLWKNVELVCKHCKLRQKGASVSDYRELRNKSLKAPLSTYAGLIGMICLVTYYYYVFKYVS